MILNATDIETGTQIDADLVIIGGGAAGITLALQFVNTRYRVVLLESGGEDFDESVQALYKGASQGIATEPLDVSRLRYLGGTTNHWSGWCRPLDPADFEPRPDWPESGWPIRYSDLEPYYRQAMEICELGPYEFNDPSYWRHQPGGEALASLPLPPDRMETSLFQISPPTRFAERYGPALEAAPNIQVILQASVLELMPAVGGGSGFGPRHVGKVNVANLSGTALTVSGRSVVLAAGGIETARLMLLSKSLNATGAGNEYDLVGRYFMDHVWVEHAGRIRFANNGLDAPLYFDQHDLAGTRVFASLAPHREYAKQKEIGGFRLVLKPSRVSDLGRDSVRAIVDRLKQGQLVDDFGDHVGNIVSDLDVLADRAIGSLTGYKENIFSPTPDSEAPYIEATIDLNFEQRPNPDSRVFLGQETDAFGQPRIALDWQFTETERRTAEYAIELTAQAFGSSGLGRVRSELHPDSGRDWLPYVTGSRHHMGTARMAADPRKGVVDANCRVHSVDNLFVVGSAVFATSGYANPTLSIVALALRLSVHLQKILA